MFEIKLEELKKEVRRGNVELDSFFHRTKTKHYVRRAVGEVILMDLLEKENFQKNESYHVISGGDVDSLSFFKFMCRKQKIKLAVVSTWCMSISDITELKRLKDIGDVGEYFFCVGEIFPSSYSNEYAKIKEWFGEDKIRVFKNHSKVYACVGDSYDFVIESSANINTNPRSEQTVITINKELTDFYIDFYKTKWQDQQKD